MGGDVGVAQTISKERRTNPVGVALLPGIGTKYRLNNRGCESANLAAGGRAKQACEFLLSQFVVRREQLSGDLPKVGQVKRLAKHCALKNPVEGFIDQWHGEAGQPGTECGDGKEPKPSVGKKHWDSAHSESSTFMFNRIGH